MGSFFNPELFPCNHKSTKNNDYANNENQKIKQNIHKNSDQYSNDDHVEKKE